MMMSVVDGKLSYKTLKKHRLINDAFLISCVFPLFYSLRNPDLLTHSGRNPESLIRPF